MGVAKVRRAFLWQARAIHSSGGHGRNNRCSAAVRLALRPRFFSRNRGKDTRVSTGHRAVNSFPVPDENQFTFVVRVVPGPQAVRDQRNLMGFKHAMSLRHSNCLKSLKSLEEAPNTQLYERCEHPTRNSWMWEFALAKALRALGFQSSIGAHCCFGGEREKWFEFRSNIPALHQYLNRALPGPSRLPGVLSYWGWMTPPRRKSTRGSCVKPMWRGWRSSYGIFCRMSIFPASNGMPPNWNRALRGWERTETKKSPPATWRSGRLPWLGGGNQMMHLRRLLSQASYRGPMSRWVTPTWSAKKCLTLPCGGSGKRSWVFLETGRRTSTSLRWPPLSLWSSTGAAVPTIVGADGSWLRIIWSSEEPSARDGHHLGVWTGFSAGRQQPS